MPDIERWGDNLNLLLNRPHIIEDKGANYDQYYYLMFFLPILLNARIIVETGLGFGQSTRIHLESLSMMNQPRELHTYTLHQYGDFTIEQIEKEIRDLNFKANWFLHQQDSATGGASWFISSGPPVPKVDLLDLDSDHCLEHVNKELNAWAPNMSDKSVIFTDDICGESKFLMTLSTKEIQESILMIRIGHLRITIKHIQNGEL